MRLRLGMSQSRELKLIMPAGALFPFYAFTFPKLIYLSVETTQEFLINLRGAPILPPTPLQTLQTLNLAFPQSFIVLVSENGVPLLETICPNLRHLRLTKSTKYLTEKQAESLPRRLQNLESLELKQAAGLSNRGYSLSYLHLVDLPASLKVLCIVSGYWKAEEGEEAYARLRWPAGLETLRVGFSNKASALHYFPPCATSIYVEVEDRSENPTTLFETSKLPKTLKRLSLYVSGFILKPDGGYPPELVSLAKTNFHSTTEIEPFRSLPQTVEDFPYIDPVFAEDRLAELLPRLKYLYIPRESPFIPKLPPFLSYLDVAKKVPPKFVTTLPASLTRLTLSGQVMHDLVGLKDATPNLETLRFSYEVLNSRLNLEAANWLPQRLTTLELAMNAFDSRESIAALPQSLTFIFLSVHEGTSELIDDPNIFLHFPPHLKRIYLGLAKRPCLWREWISCMKDRFQVLEELDLTDCERTIPGSSLDFSFLKRLPISLAILRLRTTGDLSKEPDCLKELPKDLGVLFLRPVSFGSTLIVSDENLSALPRNMYYINLWGVSGLTEAVLPLLPPSLTRLTLPVEYSQYYTKWNPEVWRGDV
jgi:hypothetical protein